MKPLRQIMDAIVNGRPYTGDLSGIGYRVLRGKSDNDFETMTDTPLTRRVIPLSPLTDAMFGKDGHTIIKDVIGYPAGDIKDYLDGGTHFRVCIFEFDPHGPVKRALWPEVVEVMAQAYPEIYFLRDDKGQPNQKLIQSLAQVPFSIFERMFGGPGSFGRIKKLGSTHPAYVTLERIQKMQELEQKEGLALVTPAIIRLFMFLACNFNPLFAGYGYTVSEDGALGAPEYIMANQPLTKLGSFELARLNVQVPALGSQR